MHYQKYLLQLTNDYNNINNQRTNFPTVCPDRTQNKRIKCTDSNYSTMYNNRSNRSIDTMNKYEKYRASQIKLNGRTSLVRIKRNQMKGDILRTNGCKDDRYGNFFDILLCRHWTLTHLRTKVKLP